MVRAPQFPAWRQKEPQAELSAWGPSMMHQFKLVAARWGVGGWGLAR